MNFKTISQQHSMIKPFLGALELALMAPEFRFDARLFKQQVRDLRSLVLQQKQCSDYDLIVGINP